MYLHPLLGPPHRRLVARYYRRVDKIVRQKLESTTASHGGLGHRRRTDRLRILNLRRTDDYFQTGLWQYIVAHLFGHPEG
jgi:hypothetical protein